MEKLNLLTDQHQNNDIFDKLGVLFDQLLLTKQNAILFLTIQNKILRIEKNIQHLKESINQSNNNQYVEVLSHINSKLKSWYDVILISSNSLTIIESFQNDLNKILEIFDTNVLFIGESNILNYFENNFILNHYTLENIGQIYLDYYGQSRLYKIDKIEEPVIKNNCVSEMELVIKKRIHDFNQIYNFFQKIYIVGESETIVNSDSDSEIKELQINETEISKSLSSTLEDSENVLYSLKIKLWIDTIDAVQANSFMNMITSSLGRIENVTITIEDSRVGSYFQDLKVKMKGWISKEEVIQVVNKSGKTAEAYIFDRHTEPIKKSKTERKKTKAEIDNMMTKNQAQQLIQIQIDSAKIDLELKNADLELKKLNVIEKRIEVTNKLSNILATGLITIDSDFQIQINDLTITEKKDGKICHDSILLLNIPIDKTKFNDDSHDQKNDSKGSDTVSVPKKSKNK